MVEKRQENGPEKERNAKIECKVDMKNSKRRLLALNLIESGGAICTTAGVPTGERRKEIISLARTKT